MDIGTLTGHIEIEDELSRGLEIAATHVEKFADKFDDMTFGILKGAGLAIAAIGGITATIIGLGNVGSEVNDITDTFERFAGSAQNASDTLDKMRENTKGVVTDFTLMKDANKLLAAGVHLTADEFGTLARAASVLADQGLGSVEENMQALNQAMLTGQTRTVQLKLGKIDLKKSEDDFAKSLNTTRDRLNAEGIAQAHRITILELANKRVSEAGEIHKSFGDIMTGVVVKIRNWGNELAGSVAKSPAVMAAVNALGKSISETFGTTGKDEFSESILSGIESFAKGVEHYGPIVIGFFGSIRDTVVKYLPDVTAFFTKIKNSAMDLWDWLQEMNDRYKITETVVKVATKAWEFLHEAIHLVEEAIKKLRDAWEEMPEWLQKVAITATLAGIGVTAAAHSIEGAAEGAGGIGHTLETGAKSIHEYGGALYYLDHAFETLMKPLEWIGLKLIEITFAFKAFSTAAKEGGVAGTVGELVKKGWLWLTETSFVRTLSLVVETFKILGEMLLAVATGPWGILALSIVGLGLAIRGLTGSWDFIIKPAEGALQAMKDLGTEIGYTLGKIDNFAKDVANSFKPAMAFVLQSMGIDAKTAFSDFDTVLESSRTILNFLAEQIRQFPGVDHILKDLDALHASAEEKRKIAASHEAAVAHRQLAGELHMEEILTPEGISTGRFRPGALLPMTSGLATLPGEQLKVPTVPTVPDKQNFLKISELQERVQALNKSLLQTSDETAVTVAWFAQLGAKQKDILSRPDLQQKLIPRVEAVLEANFGQLNDQMRTFYERAQASQHAMVDLQYNELAMQGVTLDAVESKKALGKSEAEIAESYHVSVKGLQFYTQELTKHRQVTDELTKSQDALEQAQRATDIKALGVAVKQQSEMLQESYDAGLISAEQFSTARTAIEEGGIQARLKLEDDGIQQAKEIAQRGLDERFSRGLISEKEYGDLSVALTKEYGQKRLDAEVTEADRRLKIQTDAHAALLAIEKQYSEGLKKSAMTATDYQLDQIDEWVKKTKSAYVVDSLEAAMTYYHKVEQEGERQKNDIMRNTEFLKNNTIHAYEQQAQIVENAYDDMMSRPGEFTQAVKDAQLQALIDARDKAAGVTHVWANAFKTIPETLKSAFEGGGGIEGALKSLAITFGEVFGNQLEMEIKRRVTITASHPMDEGAMSGKTLALAAEGGLVAGIGAAASGGTAKQQLGTVASVGMQVGMMAKLGGASLTTSLALAGVTMGISAAVVGAVLLVKHLQAGRKAVEDFAKSVGGFDELHTQLNKLGAEGEVMWKKLTQSGMSKKEVEAYGKTIQKTLADLEADVSKYGLSWDDVGDAQTKATKSATALEASYKRLTAAGFSTDKVLDAMSGDLNTFITTTIHAGAKIPAAMKPIIESMIRAGKVSQDAVNAIMGIESGIPPLEDIKAAADRYGISLDSLGPKVKQLEINDLAAQYVSDWDVLTHATDDWAVIIDKMGPKVQDLVTDAIHYGSTLPFAMKPMIQAMIDAGKLVDANGEKLTDLGQLHFADDLSAMFQTLIDKLDTFIDHLSELNGMTVEPKIAPKYIPPPNAPPEVSGDYTQPQYQATGGVVYAAGGYVPRGTDTVPAMLTPGEGVVTTKGMASLGASGLAAINAGAIGAAIAATSKETNQLTASLKALEAQQAEVARASFILIKGFKDQATVTDKSTDLVEQTSDQTQVLSDRIKAQNPWIGEWSQSWKRAGGQLVLTVNDSKRSVGTLGDTVDDLSGHVGNVAGDFTTAFGDHGVKGSVDGSVGSVKDFGTHVDDLGSKAGTVADAFGGSFNSSTGVRGSIDASVVSSDTLRGSVKGVGTDAPDAASSVVSASGDMQSAYDTTTGHAEGLRSKVGEIVDENGNVVSSLHVEPWMEWSKNASGYVSAVIGQVDALQAKLDALAATMAKTPSGPSAPAPPTAPGGISSNPTPPQTGPTPIPGPSRGGVPSPTPTVPPPQRGGIPGPTRQTEAPVQQVNNFDGLFKGATMTVESVPVFVEKLADVIDASGDLSQRMRYAMRVKKSA